MVEVGIVYIIPILIAFLGGKKIYGIRGGIIGALSAVAFIAAGKSNTFAEIAKSNSPMILAAIIFGPISALILKHTEKH